MANYNSKYTGEQVEAILDNAYQVPSGGIPKSDLASEVQNTLDGVVTISGSETIGGFKEFENAVLLPEVYYDDDLKVSSAESVTIETPKVVVASTDVKFDVDVNEEVKVDTDGHTLKIDAGGVEIKSRVDIKVGDLYVNTGYINAQGGYYESDIYVNGNDKVATEAQVQAKQDTISDLSTIRSGAGAGATAYQKPNDGVPKSDLSSSVQTSLERADSALQAETDPVFLASPAAGITASDIANWNSKQSAMYALTTEEINTILV